MGPVTNPIHFVFLSTSTNPVLWGRSVFKKKRNLKIKIFMTPLSGMTSLNVSKKSHGFLSNFQVSSFYKYGPPPYGGLIRGIVFYDFKLLPMCYIFIIMTLPCWRTLYQINVLFSIFCQLPRFIHGLNIFLYCRRIALCILIYCCLFFSLYYLIVCHLNGFHLLCQINERWKLKNISIGIWAKKQLAFFYYLNCFLF